MATFAIALRDPQRCVDTLAARAATLPKGNA
jgi:hypothetical protein